MQGWDRVGIGYDQIGYIGYDQMGHSYVWPPYKLEQTEKVGCDPKYGCSNIFLFFSGDSNIMPKSIDQKVSMTCQKS